jgi:hypothetical protein
MDSKYEFDAIPLSSDSIMKTRPTSCVECQQPPPKQSRLLTFSLILNWVQLIILGVVALLVMRVEMVSKDLSHSNSTQLSRRQNGKALPVSCLTGVTEKMVQQFIGSSGAMLHPGVSCPDVDLNGFYTPTDYFEVAVDPGKKRRDGSLLDSRDGNFGADHSTDQLYEEIKARSGKKALSPAVLLHPLYPHVPSTTHSLNKRLSQSAVLRVGLFVGLSIIGNSWHTRRQRKSHPQQPSGSSSIATALVDCRRTYDITSHRHTEDPSYDAVDTIADLSVWLRSFFHRKRCFITGRIF